MKDNGSATFGMMVRAALGGPPVDGVQGDPRQGGNFRIPLGRAALVASDIGGRELASDGVEWLIGDSAESPVLSRMNVLPTTETHGKVLSGDTLPQTSMQAQSFTAEFTRISGYAFPATPVTGDLARFLTGAVYASGAAFPTTPAPMDGDLFRFDAAATSIVAKDTDGTTDVTTAAVGDLFQFDGTNWIRQPIVGGALATDQTYRWGGSRWVFVPHLFAEFDFDLDSVIEAKSEISSQLAVQAGNDFAMDSVLESHRQSIADTLLVQSVAGSGVGNDLLGVVHAPGVQTATYAQADRGASAALQTAEDAVEDAGGRGAYMSWAMGRDVSASARRALLEPGSDRRVEERGRLSLSGLPVQRVVEGLAATTAVVADWRAVVQPISSELAVVVDRQTSPGDVRITSRLPVANPILSHPTTCYSLTQA